MKQFLVGAFFAISFMFAGIFFIFVGCSNSQTQKTSASAADKKTTQEKTAVQKTFTKQTAEEKTAGQKTTTKQSAKSEKSVLTVAPIFVHGTGVDTFMQYEARVKVWGSFSEQDARRLIAAEAKKAGLDFDIENNQPKVAGITSVYDGKRIPVDKKQGTILVFDGFDKAKKIAFEVLTKDDVISTFAGARETRDFLGAAKKLKDELGKKQGDYIVGIFYDPVVAPAKQNTTQLLKAQIADFIDWLKTNKFLH